MLRSLQGVSTPVLSYLPNSSGILVLHERAVLAWLFAGECRTRRQTDRFVDVAYIKPTSSHFGNPTGFMLDSESFDTTAQALDFVRSLAPMQRGVSA